MVNYLPFIVFVLIVGLSGLIYNEHSMNEKCTVQLEDGMIVDRWLDVHHSGKSTHREYNTVININGINKTIDDEDLMEVGHIGDKIQVKTWEYIEDGQTKIWKLDYET